MNSMSNFDVVIAGGRCAGAATAMLLARAGASVLLVERGQFGTDTLSTHALMRPAVMQLHRWGLLGRIVAAGTPPVRHVTFEYEDGEVEVPIKPRDGVDALYAPRRNVLDSILVEAAAEAGVTAVQGTRVIDVVRNRAGRVAGVQIEERPGSARTVQAGIVIGADGVDSTVARLVGAQTYRQGAHFGAVIYGYWPGLTFDGYRWVFRSGLSCGVIPTNDGRTCIFGSMPSDRFRGLRGRDLGAIYLDILRDVSPSLRETLASRCPPHVRGFAGRAGFFRRSWGPGWALVGDAGYFKDPITAHGITDALRDAELLARAVLAGREEALAACERQRDELSMALFEVTDEIASYDWTTERLRELHQRLSREMQHEAYTQASWTLPPSFKPTDEGSEAHSTSLSLSSIRISGASPGHN